MADVDIDPFGEHESRPEDPTDELLPQWEEDRLENQQVNKKHHSEAVRPRFAEEGKVKEIDLLINRVEGLYDRLSQKLVRTSEVFHYDLFELRDGKLYFRDKSKPLTAKKGG